MNLSKAIDDYFAAIRARDIERLMALYAENATFSLPDGRQFAGIDAIRAMHLNVFSAGAPLPFPGAMILAQSAAAVEIEARLPDGSGRHTTNHFYLNADGRIERLSVYVKTG
jgi:ketosteroid isomerase-like protein